MNGSLGTRRNRLRSPEPGSRSPATSTGSISLATATPCGSSTTRPAAATNQDSKVLDGGRELQRCLYAAAADALLNRPAEVEAALLPAR